MAAARADTLTEVEVADTDTCELAEGEEEEARTGKKGCEDRQTQRNCGD